MIRASLLSKFSTSLSLSFSRLRSLLLAFQSFSLSSFFIFSQPGLATRSENVHELKRPYVSRKVGVSRQTGRRRSRIACFLFSRGARGASFEKFAGKFEQRVPPFPVARSRAGRFVLSSIGESFSSPVINARTRSLTHLRTARTHVPAYLSTHHATRRGSSSCRAYELASLFRMRD